MARAPAVGGEMTAALMVTVDARYADCCICFWDRCIAIIPITPT
jgi:hypothetical protein